MTKPPILLGIDPGWVNLGLAVLSPNPDPDSFKFDLVYSGVFDPSKGPEGFVDTIPLIILKHLPGILPEYGETVATVERYVSYAGVSTQVTEDLTMLIGMLRMKFYNQGYNTRLTRAIDWKVFLAKTMSKHEGFANPSPSSELDKVFSVAMAKFLLTNPQEIKTSHEADAICLAALPHLATRYQQLEQAKKA